MVFSCSVISSLKHRKNPRRVKTASDMVSVWSSSSSHKFEREFREITSWG